MALPENKNMGLKKGHCNIILIFSTMINALVSFFYFFISCMIVSVKKIKELNLCISITILKKIVPTSIYLFLEQSNAVYNIIIFWEF
jgi:hypothetical protein